MLAIVGGIYALAAVVVLTWFIIDVGSALSLRDLLLQIALIGAAACGVWFVLNALENLGIQIRTHADGYRRRNTPRPI